VATKMRNFPTEGNLYSFIRIYALQIFFKRIKGGRIKKVG
jgi:hypothetical protein